MRAGLFFYRDIMKKFFIALTLLLLPTMAFAQITYPLSATVQWDPSPTSTDPTQAITAYIVTFDSTQTSVSPSTACATLPCSFKISIPDANSHAISVTAVNMWGQSAPVGFTFKAAAPGNSSNVKIRVP